MRKNAWIATTLGALCGVPLYLLLDGFDLLSPPLRERPWPLALIAAAGVFAVWRSAVAVLPALASALAVLVFAEVTAARLPAQASALISSAPLPDAALLSDTGSPLRLTDLRGPMVLVVYRGSS